MKKLSILCEVYNSYPLIIFCIIFVSLMLALSILFLSLSLSLFKIKLGSIIVNPWNTEELANAMYDAVTMSDEMRKINHQKLYRYVTKYTAAYWGLSFVKDLQV